MIGNFYRLRKYCKNYEKIENYDKAVSDTTQTWECHHRMELITTGAVVNSSVQDLKDWGIYYDRPADELIFLTKDEHRKLHQTGKQVSKETRKLQSKAKKGKKGHKLSDETKKKISISNTGKSHPAWNKGVPCSEEAKRKMSEALKGKPSNRKGKTHSDETRKKISEKLKEMHLVSPMKGKTHSDEAKEKNRLAHLGKKGPNCGKSWFTNGEVNVMASECPDGFWKGMTRR